MAAKSASKPVFEGRNGGIIKNINDLRRSDPGYISGSRDSRIWRCALESSSFPSRLFVRKTTNRSLAGSIQMKDPVEAKCPNAEEENNRAVQPKSFVCDHGPQALVLEKLPDERAHANPRRGRPGPRNLL